MKDTAEKLATKWIAAERQYRDQVREATHRDACAGMQRTPTNCGVPPRTPDRIRAGGQRKR